MSTSLKLPCDQAAILAATPGASSPQQGTWVLVATILGSSMPFIDGTVVNVALPALQRSLGANVAQVQWIVECYALFLAALLLVGGALGDLYGRRKLFTLGTILFAAASAWCGLAPNVTQLIAARGLQGIGGALLIPGSLALISASFPAAERGRAIGTWSGFTAITAAVGPVLGGWLIENASWRWVFFMNLPIAALVVAVSLRLPESRDPERAGKPLDWLGALLATIGLGGVVLALIEPARAPVAASIGIATLVAFLIVERRSPAPMLPLDLFRSQNFAGANLLTLFLYTALSGVLFFFPLDLIEVQHYTATEAGAALVPLVLLIFLLSRWSGGLVARYGAKPPLVVGPLIAALGFGLFAIPSVGAPYWSTFFPAVLVLGLGVSISVAPLTTAVMNSVPENRAGAASGVNNAVSRLAGLLAVALLGAVLIAVFNHNLDQRLNQLHLSATVLKTIDVQRPKLAAIETADPNVQKAVADSFVAGYRITTCIGVALSLASSLSAAFFITSRPHSLKKSS